MLNSLPKKSREEQRLLRHRLRNGETASKAPPQSLFKTAPLPVPAEVVSTTAGRPARVDPLLSSPLFARGRSRESSGPPNRASLGGAPGRSRGPACVRPWRTGPVAWRTMHAFRSPVAPLIRVWGTRSRPGWRWAAQRPLPSPWCPPHPMNCGPGSPGTNRDTKHP